MHKHIISTPFKTVKKNGSSDKEKKIFCLVSTKPSSSRSPHSIPGSWMLWERILQWLQWTPQNWCRCVPGWGCQLRLPAPTMKLRAKWCKRSGTASCTNKKVWEKAKEKKSTKKADKVSDSIYVWQLPAPTKRGTAGQHAYLIASCTNNKVWEKAKEKESIKQADKVRDSGTACVLNSFLHQQ